MPRELSYHSMMDRWRRSVSEFFAFVSSIFFLFHPAREIIPRGLQREREKEKRAREIQ